MLKALVQAARTVRRDQRQKFVLPWTSDRVQHHGLPGDGVIPVYEGDIDVLKAEGLLEIKYSERHSDRARRYRDRVFDITLLGFRVYDEMQRRSGDPAQQVEEELKRYLEADAFQRSYPEAYRKWAEAAKLLWASDSQEQLTTVGHLCREAIQAFATRLVDRYQPPGVDTDKTHDVARIRAVLDQHRPRLGKTTAPFLDALLAYWGTVSDLVQRQEHGAQKEGRPLVREDGRRVVFQTANVMFEIDRALS